MPAVSNARCCQVTAVDVRENARYQCAVGKDFNSKRLAGRIIRHPSFYDDRVALIETAANRGSRTKRSRRAAQRSAARGLARFNRVLTTVVQMPWKRSLETMPAVSDTGGCQVLPVSLGRDMQDSKTIGKNLDLKWCSGVVCRHPTRHARSVALVEVTTDVVCDESLSYPCN